MAEVMNMKINIRQEIENDHQAVHRVIEDAFRDEEMSDHKEQFLVERLRKSPAFVPEISLVAEYYKQVVGHILLTKIGIKSEQQIFPSLALAPVSVLPEFQHKGIGGKLVQHAHAVAASLSFKSVILLGHPGYYPRFGYRRASEFGITLPFDAPDECCMAVELTENGLVGVKGIVEYPEELS